jgi:hypothetical protein
MVRSGFGAQAAAAEASRVEDMNFRIYCHDNLRRSPFGLCCTQKKRMEPLSGKQEDST